MLRKWWVLASVACGTFMATLDSSIVNIALPTLTKTLVTDLYQIKWVVILYLLAITCLLLPFGKLSDLYGRRRIFQLGFLIFVIGSACCGSSSDLSWLLASRFLQGIGASMLMANGPAIITACFPSSERGKALGILAMVVSAGLVSGPSVGGFLITTLGWRSIFWVNIPVGFFGAALVYRFVPAESRPAKKAPFDWAGALLQMILLVSFIILVDPPMISVSGSIPMTIPRLMIGGLMVLIAAIFYKVESDAQAPVLDFSLLKIRTFSITNLASFLTFVSYSSLSVLMPFFLEEVLHLKPDTAGLFMTAIPLTIFVVAPISGRLSDRLGSRELSFAGSMVGAIGLFIMAGVFGLGIYEHVSGVGVILGLCSIGLATGLFQSPNNNAMMSVVPTHKLGVASAFLGTVRNLGLVTGTGMATGLFAWRQRVTGDFVQALHFTFFVAGMVAVAAMLVSSARRIERP